MLSRISLNEIHIIYQSSNVGNLMHRNLRVTYSTSVVNINMKYKRKRAL
jgi:hypothetical protein